MEVIWQINRTLKTEADEDGPGAETSDDDAGIRFYGARYMKPFYEGTCAGTLVRYMLM